ncbi:MAG TPA: hypothetical protein VMU42_11360 [Candidatus Sulfotelmatobacter sp.]|nr:hypothetical protein [Candidatus Sulfotelmatobacter sp.]
MLKASQLAAALLLASAPAWAGPLRPNANRPESDEQQYQSCIALTRSEPDDAFEAAITWRDQGGGFPAKHCVALALIALKQYAEGAERLEELAKEMNAKAEPLQGEVLDQSGNAWILAGQAAHAVSVLTAAIDIKPENVDFLIDRARAYAADSNYAAAAKDLDRAVHIAPERADALAFRASARRHLGDKKGAMADADAALALDSGQVAALLERGILRRDAGDKAGARKDWLKVVLLAPNTPAADSAQTDMEQMDMKPE